MQFASSEVVAFNLKAAFCGISSMRICLRFVFVPMSFLLEKSTSNVSMIGFFRSMVSFFWVEAVLPSVSAQLIMSVSSFSSPGILAMGVDRVTAKLRSLVVVKVSVLVPDTAACS